MSADPQIGFDVDPAEQRRSENQNIEQEGEAAEGESQAQETSEEAQDEATPEASDKAKEELDLYSPDARPTVVVPGSDGTLTGTAFADWVDENGELKEEHNHPTDEAEAMLDEIDQKNQDEGYETPKKTEGPEHTDQPDETIVSDPEEPEGNPEPTEPPDE